MIFVPLLFTAAFVGQIADQTDSQKGRSHKLCTLLACPTEAVIEIQRKDRFQADYELVIDFDGTKERCRLVHDELPELPNCGSRSRVQLSGNQTGGDSIAVFGKPSKISITLSDHGRQIATKTFEPVYAPIYPNGKDCGEGCKFWRTVWTLP